MRKGQVSYEMIALFGFIIVTLILLTTFAFNSSQTQRTVSEAEIAAERIATAAESVHSQGPGAVETVDVFIPEFYESTPASFVERNIVNIKIYTQDGELYDVVRILSFNVTGYLPTNAGNQPIRIESLPDGTVVIEGVIDEAEDHPEQGELCHHPPGNPTNCQTITVGEPAVKHHLDHGDYLGLCDICNVNDDGDVDTGTDDDGDGKIDVCHHPPGNLANCHTISIGQQAASAHISHGDYEGVCDSNTPNTDSNGCYTEDDSSGNGGDTGNICHHPPGNRANCKTLTVGEPAVSSHIENHQDYEGSCTPTRPGTDDSGCEL